MDSRDEGQNGPGEDWAVARKRRKFTEEFKAEAVRVVREAARASSGLRALHYSITARRHTDVLRAAYGGLR